MKAQLKELAIQAKLPSYLLEYGTELCVAPHLEKFAELIVRECANFVDYRLTNPNGASIAWCDGSDIKEHFRVE